jgi:hypothetical protein
MDFDPYRSHWHENVLPMTLLEMCWQMKSPRGLLLTCGVFRTIAGLEVRCSYPNDDLIRSQYVVEISAARELAGDWKSAAKTKGYQDASGG